MTIKKKKLKELLNLNNFNTNNVTYMSCMFGGCSSLKELNLINFNTENVTDMSSMFYGCSSLKELNLKNFNTNNVTNIFNFNSSKHPSNKQLISVTLLVLKLLRFNSFNDEHFSNIRLIKSQFKNFKEEAFKI